MVHYTLKHYTARPPCKRTFVVDRNTRRRFIVVKRRFICYNSLVQIHTSGDVGFGAFEVRQAEDPGGGKTREEV